MNYEQLIEELREEMLQLVNTKCDALLQMYRSGEQHTNVKDTIRESSLITVSPAELKGKRPLAVQFALGEWIETPTWRKVAQKILQTLFGKIALDSVKIADCRNIIILPDLQLLFQKKSIDQGVVLSGKAALRFGQRDGNRGLRRRPCFPFFFLNAVDRIRREVLPVLHQ